MAIPIHEFAQLPRMKPAAAPQARLRRVRDAGAAPTVGVIYNPPPRPRRACGGCAMPARRPRSG